jgi:response regulator RpfG family c-di-GMP phosphodiesterase
MVTAYAEIPSAIAFFTAATEKVMAMDYIAKPVKASKLMEDVETVLQRVYEKRVGHLKMSANEIHARLARIEDMLSSLDRLPEIDQSLREIERKNRGVLADLGMELVKAIVIAIGLLALLYLGIGDFVRKIIQAH